MKASKKVMYLYLIRLLLLAGLLSALSTSLYGVAGVGFLWVLAGVLLLCALLGIYLFMLYKSLFLTVEKSHLTYTYGVILKHEIRISYKNIAAVTETVTPLERLFRLCNLHLKVQGAKFLLFSLSRECADSLKEAIEKHREENR